LFGGGQRQVSENIETIGGSRNRRSQQPSEFALHRFSRREVFGLHCDQPECQRAVVRRTSDQRLCWWTGRRFLQRSAGLLPIDQLCPAILSRTAYDAGCAGAEDSEDVPRTGGQRPLQLRSAVAAM